MKNIFLYLTHQIYTDLNVWQYHLQARRWRNGWGHTLSAEVEGFMTHAKSILSVVCKIKKHISYRSGIPLTVIIVKNHFDTNMERHVRGCLQSLLRTIKLYKHNRILYGSYKVLNHLVFKERYTVIKRNF